jgi:thiol peroxidase
MIYKKIFTAVFIFFNIINPAHSTANDKNLVVSTNQVKIGSKTVILSGNTVTTGQKAPDFKVVDEQFNVVNLTDFSGKTLLISVVPSIDTGICSLQTKRFNDEVINLPNSVILLTISADLPFAQKRFCIQEKVDKVQLLSDSVWRDFGLKYGLLIKDMGLLTRAILIVDEQGIINYQQIVPELSKQPDYDDALKALKALLPEV